MNVPAGLAAQIQAEGLLRVEGAGTGGTAATDTDKHGRTRTDTDTHGQTRTSGNAAATAVAAAAAAANRTAANRTAASAKRTANPAAATHRFVFDAAGAKLPGLRVGVVRKVAALENFRLTGELDRSGERLTFTLEAIAKVRASGTVLTVLRGDVALVSASGNTTATSATTATTATTTATTPAYTVALGGDGYVLRFAKAGAHPVRLQFVAKLNRSEDTTAAAFAVGGVAVAPFVLRGFSEDAQFVVGSGMPPVGSAVSDSQRDASAPAAKVFSGHLSPRGVLDIAWRKTKTADTDARLFFSTEETTEITVRPGLLQQSARFRYQVLQGKLETLRFALEGPGEILRVTGEDVLSWKVEDAAPAATTPTPATPAPAPRTLAVRLAQPKSGTYDLFIETRAPLGDFPVATKPLSIAPLDGVRHGGFVRVVNEGAVRLETTPRAGLTQVVPSLFPAQWSSRRTLPENTQRFVYRVASAQTTLDIRADNILPETNVSALALYRVTESDFLVDAEVELDVREAPLREFVIGVPVGYTVSQTAQLDEWGHTLGPATASASTREMRVTFARPLQGRGVIKFRLEQSRPTFAAPAAAPKDTAAVWQLPPLAFPGAKSVRGHVGVAAAAGLRVTPLRAGDLAEIAPAFFPRREDGLQQAYRLRAPAWSASFRVEKLDLAVQTDALHLFAVREGMIAASTTVNYVITGAPLGEFAFAAPAAARNLEFAGKDIRAWKRDGGTVTVALHKPVSGVFTLLGAYDLPLDPRGGVADLSGLRPLRTQSETGAILVTSNLQFDVRPEAVSPALLPVEPGEIPPEHRMMADAPLLAAYQYAARPFDLRLALAPRPQSRTLNQVADFASLATHISRDNQVVTQARYLVKSHGHPHLRVVAPPGLTLWEARVDKAAVLPVTDKSATLIPLPSRPDANTLLDVDLRFAGAAAPAASAQIRLDAPRLDAPVVNTHWKITTDKGDLLRLNGGNLAPHPNNALHQPPASSAFLSGGTASNFLGLLGFSAAVAFSAALLFFFARKLRREGFRKTAYVPAATAVATILAAFFICIFSLNERWAAADYRSADVAETPTTLVFTAPFHEGAGASAATAAATAAKDTGHGTQDAAAIAAPAAPAAPPALPAHHLVLLRDTTGGGGFFAIVGHLLFLAVGVAAIVRALRRKSPALRALAWAWFGAGIVAGPATHYGWFSLLFALFFVLEILVPGIRGLRATPIGNAAGTGPAAAALALFATAATAAPAFATPRPADFLSQEIHVGRAATSADATIRFSGNTGDRFDLLAEPAVLVGTALPLPPKTLKTSPTEFDDAHINGRLELPAGVRLEKTTREGRAVTQLVLEKPLTATLAFRYQLPVTLAHQTLRLPTSVATIDTANVRVATGELLLTSATAVLLSATDASTRQVANVGRTSAAYFSFLPQAERTVRWAPKTRDRSKEPLVFYAETADFYVPSSGVLDGRHVLKIRPAQGLLSEVSILVPAGLTVADVNGTGVSRWRFDPAARRLHVRIEPANATLTTLGIGTQRGVGALPQPLAFAPLTVEAAAGQLGMVALGSGDDIQLSAVKATQMLAVSNADFELGATDTGLPADTKIRRAFRYNGTGATLAATVEAVEPEVRADATQQVSLGEDRTVLNALWNVDITRAGVFRLSFDLPENLEVESISGPSLSHWTETAATAAAPRRVVLHLRGRTLGRQHYSLALAGAGIAGKKKWDAPRLVLREASRQTGTLTLVPEEGVRLHVATRRGAAQYDPGTQVRLPKSALAFRLPQRDWHLAFDIESLAPWIQTSHLQDITIRDGQLRAIANFEYTIENAATKTLRVRLPAAATSVRFSGPLVADAVKTNDTATAAAATAANTPPLDIWEVRLVRRALGKTTLRATYQLPLDTAALANIAGISAADAGLQHGWLALRASGRLELKLPPLPAALAASDWQAIPATLRRGLAEPSAVLRTVENRFALPVAVAAHDPARLLAIRVEKAELFTILSDGRRMLTRVLLTARPDGKGLLRVTLPADATYWHGFVNDEPIRAALDAGTLLLPVSPNPETGKPATVEFYYAAPTTGGILDHKLTGPRFDVPLENISWRVRLPDGQILAKQESTLRHVPNAPAPTGRYGVALGTVEQYLAANASRQTSKHEQARNMITLGNRLKTNDQWQAVQALTNAANLSKGDAALNEDARVQLKVLRQEQIEVGMNRWRQSNRRNLGPAQTDGNDGSFQGNAAPIQGTAAPIQTTAADSIGNLALSTASTPSTASTSSTVSAQSAYTQGELVAQRRQNTAEENEVSRKMAERFLTQQTSIAGTLDSIRTLLPAQGRSLLFERTLQVSSSTDLSLNLSLAPATGDGGGGSSSGSGARLWLLALAILGVFLLALFLPKLAKR
ncbi:MAG: hypothetical protein LBT53_06980 [Puniceicoccales bacterium]|nr:hypothetical protein [Puniceicoccales bacterium]